jgi:hypothetical protein
LLALILEQIPVAQVGFHDVVEKPVIEQRHTLDPGILGLSSDTSSSENNTASLESL